MDWISDYVGQIDDAKMILLDCHIECKNQAELLEMTKSGSTNGRLHFYFENGDVYFCILDCVKYI